MAKTYGCVYESVERLNLFLEEHKFTDVPNLIIHIISSEETRIETLKQRLENQFPASTVLEYSTPIKNISEEQIFILFTLIEEKFLNFLYYDFDTGLPNRMKFTEQLRIVLGRFCQGNEPLALLVIDMDRFKNINDTLGHYVGDLLLKQVALRLKEGSPPGSYLARFAGDKFTLLISKDTSVSKILTTAEKLLESIAVPVQFNGQELFLTASIGISYYPNDGHDEHALLKNADTAMNRSKTFGGNRITFYATEMKGKAMFRFELENYLRRANTNKNQEFYLCYQPLIDLKTAKIIGNEALIRWNHPRLGLVSPAEFIPLAEEIGIIDEIGTWVLNSACQQTKKWQQAGISNLEISVNVSARQFQHPCFFNKVQEALNLTGLESKYLTLELTESAMLQNLDYSISIMEALQKTGVKVAIDDFGTGYSSLSYLRSLPINSLKIDRAFINNLKATSADLAIVKAIITMGHGLAIDVIAEGVETKEQIELLRNLECHYAQGFFIQKPLVSGDFEKIVLPK
ncbi:bifunctional diguanylate cyclase/phosphodiesterase [Bacillus sp. B15-48]|uniref:putative bifunctional diguanylate cyclase/phosphodiesterase n=1 Tax=Bacillus sp. B15-48 TaxID=1548601 RepID=UPI00193EF5BE|nr:bifunctional diguanylate cyclase/phosphodiesterase [Bacillus sp. B15-48]MBM4764204.1 EAL domain-containing protein [Bacillus sp. B15-48]